MYNLRSLRRLIWIKSTNQLESGTLEWRVIATPMQNDRFVQECESLEKLPPG